MLNNNVENWRDLVGFEGNYEVSDLGRVRSIKTSQGTKRERLKKFSERSGYLYVNLWKENKPYNEAVHRAVAKAFLPNPKATVNHIDGDKHNNRLSNLEWATHSENHKHAFRIGLKSKETCRALKLGTKSPNAKSKYHNVSYDSTRNKWVGSIKMNKKVHGNKRFDTEIEAAVYVNYLLDLHGLTDRPRNIV